MRCPERHYCKSNLKYLTLFTKLIFDINQTLVSGPKTRTMKKGSIGSKQVNSAHEVEKVVTVVIPFTHAVPTNIIGLYR